MKRKSVALSAFLACFLAFESLACPVMAEEECVFPPVTLQKRIVAIGTETYLTDSGERVEQRCYGFSDGTMTTQGVIDARSDQPVGALQIGDVVELYFPQSTSMYAIFPSPIIFYQGCTARYAGKATDIWETRELVLTDNTGYCLWSDDEGNTYPQECCWISLYKEYGYETDLIDKRELPVGTVALCAMNDEDEAIVLEVISTGGNDAVPAPKPKPAEMPEFLLGDLNDDHDVTIVDCIILNKNLMIGTPLSQNGTAAADFNQDGNVDEADALGILKHIVGLA